MLRVRSGESQAAKPPAADETALAEMGKVIADAQAEINRLVQLGELQNDPIRYPIQALSVHLDALYKVTRASIPALAQQLRASAQRDDPTKRDDELAVIPAFDAQAGKMRHRPGVRTIIVGAGLLAAGVLAGAGAGYWFEGQNTEAAGFVKVPAALGAALTGPDAAQWTNLIRLNDIDKAERVCGAQAGGVACTISLWVTPPTAKDAQPKP